MLFLEEPLEQAIAAHIEGVVATAKTATAYRRPLIAFVNANHPEFAQLKARVDPAHLLPDDVLSEAKSVISFFLPFDAAVVKANARSAYTAREWAVAYIETNTLIGQICASLSQLLAGRGYAAQWELPTHNFDPVRLISRWSHKSVGVIAGLGSFGLHHMVITDAGCAGRFGSLITTAPLVSTSPLEPDQQRCRYFADGGCTVCVDRCPVQALRTDGLDSALCYQRCLEVDQHFSDLGLTDVCGKCATGPCALAPAP